MPRWSNSAVGPEEPAEMPEQPTPRPCAGAQQCDDNHGGAEPLPTYGDPTAVALVDLNDREALAAALDQ